MERFTNAVGAAAFLASVGVVSYVAVTRSGDASTTALGAVIALLSAGAGYFLRGRVQGTSTNNDSAGASGATEGNVLLRAEGPATATVRTDGGSGGIRETDVAASEK